MDFGGGVYFPKRCRAVHFSPLNAPDHDERLVQEYLLSEDKEEAARCIKELEVPHYHHEVVYRLVLMALEKSPSSPTPASAAGASAAVPPVVSKAVALLASVRQKGIVSERQIQQGFARVHAALPDVKIDVPHAEIALAVIEREAARAGCLPATKASGGAAGPSTAAPSNGHTSGGSAGAASSSAAP